MSVDELDARRLLCPMPVIRTQDKIKTLNAGDILKVFCTDPGVKQDIPAWCRVHGHQIIDCHEVEGEIIVTIEVGDG
ncbi:MAG TPA: sulfurtransferase TusA family protein [Gammaproteobacteria bacterium]|nr:sulfurtransferase TusA family protein [Gammaproteobacteria bacterium]